MRLLLLLACSPSLDVPRGDWANVAPAQVAEVSEGDGRTYLRVVEAQYNFWASVPELDVEVGDHVLLGRGPLVYGHRSAETGRLFDSLTVIESAAVVSAEVAMAAARLPVAEGGIDIAGVYAQRLALKGQTVKLRGRVVKASYNRVNTNWYHLRDGSRGPGDGEDDLTVTSDEKLEVGMVVVATGPLTTDKDLGFGYTYAALVEGATMVVEP
jgi:hypothetical protein